MDDRRILYLGLDVPAKSPAGDVTHFPLIKIVPLPPDNAAIAAAYSSINDFTHVIFTSKSAVEIFFLYAQHYGIEEMQLSEKAYIAVGRSTAAKITSHISVTPLIAQNETAEGVVSLLKTLDLENAFIFWPHSALSRPVIDDWLNSSSIPHLSCPFYNTLPILPANLPNLEQFDEIIFTSPSIIDAFILNYHALPKDTHFSCIGPVTQAHLEKYL